MKLMYFNLFIFILFVIKVPCKAQGIDSSVLKILKHSKNEIINDSNFAIIIYYQDINEKRDFNDDIDMLFVFNKYNLKCVFAYASPNRIYLNNFIDDPIPTIEVDSTNIIIRNKSSHDLTFSEHRNPVDSIVIAKKDLPFEIFQVLNPNLKLENIKYVYDIFGIHTFYVSTEGLFWNILNYSGRPSVFAIEYTRYIFKEVCTETVFTLSFDHYIYRNMIIHYLINDLLITDSVFTYDNTIGRPSFNNTSNLFWSDNSILQKRIITSSTGRRLQYFDSLGRFVSEYIEYEENGKEYGCFSKKILYDNDLFPYIPSEVNTIHNKIILKILNF